MHVAIVGDAASISKPCKPVFHMPIEVHLIDKAHTGKRKAWWAATGVLEQSFIERCAKKSFDEVLELRRSPSMIEEVRLECTLAFLKQVFRTREVGQDQNSGLARKSSISAGALHPIDVLVVAGPEVQEPILFSDRSDKFLTLSVKCPQTLSDAVADCRAIFPSARGHLILFTGDKRRVAEKYRPAESLLWRDAGAALQTYAMAAFAYGFAFCPLGDTGGAILDQLDPPHEEFVALATGVFGQVRTK